MKSLNVLASITLAIMPLVAVGQSAMAKGLPEFFYGTNELVNLGTQTPLLEVWTVNGVKYTDAAGMNNVEWTWAKKHYVKIFSNQGAYFVNLSAFIKAFYHPFHPTYDGPNLAPHPVGITMKQWEAAVVQAREAASALQNASASAVTGTSQYSPLATRKQWFPDPSDPFFNKSFPVKDLKDGFVLSRKPLVIVMKLKGHSGISINQYVGGGNQGTFWMTEDLNTHGQLIDVVPALGVAPNGMYPYLHPYKGLGVTVNAVAVPDMIWAAGLGKNVVPLPKWNPLWVIAPQNA